MRLNKFGRFVDPYRGDGWFVSWGWDTGHLLIGIRPFNWHWYLVRLPSRPCTQRLYIGPVEIELRRAAKA